MKAPLVACAVGGLSLALAFPPTCIDLLVWVAFIPLLAALSSEQRGMQAALHGAVFGLAFFAVDVRWVYQTMITHGHFGAFAAAFLFVAMAVVLSAFPALFGYLTSRFVRRGVRVTLVAPFLWTGLEFARANLLTGFPWDLTGYALWPRPMLVQLADITGVYGISCLVVLVSAAGWEVIGALIARQQVPWRLPVAAACGLAAAAGYGMIRLDHYPPSPLNERTCAVGILQGNIPQDVKWEPSVREHTFAVYERLGRGAVQDGALLLIWPETSVPILFGGSDKEWTRTGFISEALGVPMLVGAPSQREGAQGTEYYNSAFLMDGTRLRFRYDKIHLVPFGEYMPLSRILPLGPGIAAREADYSAGDRMTVMSVAGAPPFSVLICYEAIFPELARLALANGARLLVNITNDGWFGDSAAPYQHLVLAGMRSIEHRVWLLRAANTGVSAAFDPAGRMVNRIPLDREGFIVVRIPAEGSGGSFYSSFGDVFACCCIATCALTVIGSRSPQRRRVRGERGENKKSRRP